MDMGGRVLGLRAGAALLAAVFFAAVAARGQTLAPPVPDTADSECGLWAENPRAEALYAADAFRGPEGPRFHLFDTSLLSSGDSRDAELPDAPVARADAAAPASAAAIPDDPANPDDQVAPYIAITGRGRVVWVVKSTLWPQHLAAGVLTMGIATAMDAPPEDGPHWGGFGERFGIRLTSVAVNGTIEASLGSLWGEDPRYFRVPEESFGARVRNVIKMTFFAQRTDGSVAPAYALFIGVSGGNFLSNAWRPDSAADNGDALRRSFEGIGGHMASNAWSEFWPDAKRCIFHHCRQP